jgi:nucleoside-diphosphate-sugar epimerase
MKQAKTALVLGANGGLGGATLRALLAHGWQVRALVRQPDAAPRMDGVDWVGGDALIGADVLAAAQGMAVIVHAVNPPGYRDWHTLALPMLDNTIDAARAVGARIVFPGNIYNFGSGNVASLSESTAQTPTTRKGAIRREMERRLAAAAREGVRTLVLRAGDFFGAPANSTWFAQVMVKPGRPLGAVSYPGRAGVGHSWAYLPDVAETMVRLLEQEARLAPFDCFHMRGHWDADGTALMAAVRRVSGQPALRIKSVPWMVMRLLAPFWGLMRELVEVRYLWEEPFKLDNAKLVSFLGAEVRTPFDEALAATLAGMGCLPAPSPAPAPSPSPAPAPGSAYSA